MYRHETAFIAALSLVAVAACRQAPTKVPPPAPAAAATPAVEPLKPDASTAENYMQQAKELVEERTKLTEARATAIELADGDAEKRKRFEDMLEPSLKKLSAQEDAVAAKLTESDQLALRSYENGHLGRAKALQHLVKAINAARPKPEETPEPVPAPADAKPKTIKAFGIKWEIDSSVTASFDVKKVTCELAGPNNFCEVVAFPRRDMGFHNVHAAIYDADGIQDSDHTISSIGTYTAGQGVKFKTRVKVGFPRVVIHE